RRAAVYVGERTSDLRTLAANALGDMRSYTVVDLSTGVEINNFHYGIYLSRAAALPAEIIRDRVGLHRPSERPRAAPAAGGDKRARAETRRGSHEPSPRRTMTA